MAKKVSSSAIGTLVGRIMEAVPVTDEAASAPLQEQIDQTVNATPRRMYTPDTSRYFSELPTDYPYDLFPVPNFKEHPVYYPRPLSIMTRCFDGVCEDINDANSATAADVKAVTQAIFRQMRLQMGRGVRIEIAPLGVFYTTLTCKKPSSDYNLSPEKLRIGHIHFIPSMELKQAFLDVPFSRRHRYKGELLSFEKRKENILNFLAQKPVITIRDAEVCNWCSYSQASLDLRKMVDEKKLFAKHVGSLKLYFLK